MGEQVGGILIVNAHVVVAERPGKEVVDLPGNVENVAHPEEER